MKVNKIVLASHVVLKEGRSLELKPEHKVIYTFLGNLTNNGEVEILTSWKDFFKMIGMNSLNRKVMRSANELIEFGMITNEGTAHHYVKGFNSLGCGDFEFENRLIDTYTGMFTKVNKQEV